jgi:hypothetical protein
MKEVYIHEMIRYKKYLFTLVFDDIIEIFTGYFDKYYGEGWIKIYDMRSFISKDKLKTNYIKNFQAYELKETYNDMLLRYLKLKRGTTINIDIKTIIRTSIYTSIFCFTFYTSYYSNHSYTFSIK